MKRKLSDKLAKLSNTLGAQVVIGEFETLADLTNSGLQFKDGSLAIISSIKATYAYDLETNTWANTGVAGSGDMLVSTYDPQNVAADVFDVDNHLDGTTNKVFTATEKTKLANIEPNATADLTASEIKTLYESNSNTNAFTDALETKLNNIEASADVTDDANVKAALDGMSLTDAGTPASNDKVLIQDTSDSNNLKYVQVSTLGGGSSDHGTLSGLGDDDHTQYAIITTGSTAPSSTPSRPGAIYIDTTADNAYIAVGSASSADWQEQVNVDGTSLANGEILIWDSANSKFKRDNRTVSTGAVTTIDMNSIMGNYYSSTTSSTSASYTLQNVLPGGRSTIRISNSTSGGPTFSGSGLTVTKLGDWTTNYSTTGINTIYLEAVTATLIYCWITAVD